MSHLQVYRSVRNAEMNLQTDVKLGFSIGPELGNKKKRESLYFIGQNLFSCKKEIIIYITIR